MAEAKHTPDGGAAFPHQFEDASGHPRWKQAEGMSLRDYFAIHAEWEDVRHYSSDEYGRNISRPAARYRYADAMLAAREAEGRTP